MSSHIIKINGPLVVCNHPEQFSMSERLSVGESGLIGEVIRLESGMVAVQVYEDTTGLKLGEDVQGTGASLSVELGPGLLGSIFDGVQRPLQKIEALSGSYIKRGIQIDALDRDKQWLFEPVVKAGDRLSAGSIIGQVQESDAICHRILMPPDCGGELLEIREAGQYRLDEPIASIKLKSGALKDVFMFHSWPVRSKRPIIKRLIPTEPLITGQRIIDTFFPISKGGTAAIPGGFGTGKTVTQHNLAKWCDADVIVYVGCGERGNEMTGVIKEFPRLIDPRSGHALIERTVMIANTSDMPVAAREASIYTGITIAEYFRDQGFDVALMADSTSRWAEALREISGRLEEMPAEEGFPAYLPTRMAEFYERAGRVRTLAGATGSVSAIGSISPPGGDFSEPVTVHTRRFVKCYWALDKELANARFYPAIHPLDSYSEYGEELKAWWSAVDPQWQRNREQIMEIMHRADKLAQVVRIMGEEGLPEHQRKILLVDRLIRDAFLQQSAFSDNDCYATPEKQVRLLSLICRVAGALLADQRPVDELAAAYRISDLIRLKDEVPSESVEEMDDWEIVHA
jgi:V/A-type H+-transporting ATPase subunit A